MRRSDRWFVAGYLVFIVTVGVALATSPGLHGKAGNITFDGTGTVVGGSADKVAFFGGTPIVREPANADTSAATLANLEIEVNQLKALLRNYNLMAP